MHNSNSSSVRRMSGRGGTVYVAEVWDRIASVADKTTRRGASSQTNNLWRTNIDMCGVRIYIYTTITEKVLCVSGVNRLPPLAVFVCSRDPRWSRTKTRGLPNSRHTHVFGFVRCAMREKGRPAWAFACRPQNVSMGPPVRTSSIFMGFLCRYICICICCILLYWFSVSARSTRPERLIVSSHLGSITINKLHNIYTRANPIPSARTLHARRARSQVNRYIYANKRRTHAHHIIYIQSQVCNYINSTASAKQTIIIIHNIYFFYK